MKRILIICYEFPPFQSIATHRPYAWYKYLPEFNWHPIVVTRHWDQDILKEEDYIKPSQEETASYVEHGNRTLVSVPHQPNLRDKIILNFGLHKFVLPRKALTALHSVIDYAFLWPDNRSGIYYEAKKYLKLNNVDCIIATGEPFITFKYAYLLSKEFGIPWVADYRDGWTTNESKVRNSILNQFYRIFERRWTRTAKLRTFASVQYKNKVEEELFSGNTFCHYNGYFEEDTPKKIYNNNNNIVRIGYAGTLYPHQPLEEFVDGLKKVSTVFPFLEVEVTFFGADFYSEQKNRIIKAFDSSTISCVTTPRLKHNEMMTELVKQDILLLLSSPLVVQLYAKVFDYLSIKKPILNFKGDKGDLNRILSELNFSTIANNQQELIKILNELFKQKQDRIPNSIEFDTKKFSRREQVKNLALHLDSII